MFNILKLRVNYLNDMIEPTDYVFDKVTYIYGRNNVGKSAMLYALDYVLGKSQVSLNEKEGLNNISSIEILFGNEEEKMFLKRNVEDEYFYKMAEEDEYFQVDDISYKQQISNLINRGQEKYLEEFYNFNEENLTSRAFSFFNFIDEKGLGNLANVFTRANDYEHQKRLRKIMTFLYNYKNVHQICELNKKEKELNKKIANYNEQRVKYNYFYNEIIKYLIELNIESSGTVEELYSRFKKYKEGFNRDNKVLIKKDLNELLKASFAISEELKYQQNLENQSQKLIDRNKKAELVLNAFNDVIKNDNKWKDYTKEIRSLISKSKLNIDILSIKDYKKTIELLTIKKNKIDKEINILTKGLNKTSFEKNVEIINVLDHLFENIKHIEDIEEYDKLKTELEEIQNKKKILNKLFDNNLTSKFNKLMFDWYSKIGNNVDFAKEDLNKNGFSMDFNPIETSIVGNRFLKDEDKEKSVYIPGSMARQTTWQILGYLTNLKILIDNFEELPFFRILVIDGINQPFDENPNTYPEVFKLIRDISLEIGVQLIVVSTIDRSLIDEGKQIDLSGGFNKAHNL